MNNTICHSLRPRIKMLPAVLWLLILLSASFLSVSHQNGTETPLGQGFVSSSDQMIVALHNRAFRAQPGAFTNAGESAGDTDNGPDNAQWLRDATSSDWAGKFSSVSVAAATSLDAPLSTIHYLVPLLRAPPQA